MSKSIPILIAAACGLLGFAAMAVLGPSDFNYANEPESRQQKKLENIAKGFEIGFKTTSRGMAEINRIRADAETDTISVDIRFIRADVEHAPANAIAEFRREVYKNNCAFLDNKSLLDEGVTLRIRMTKPSGSALTNFTINKDGCRPYLDAA